MVLNDAQRRSLEQLKKRICETVCANELPYFPNGSAFKHYGHIARDAEALDQFVGRVLENSLSSLPNGKIVIGNIGQALPHMQRSAQKVWTSLLESELCKIDGLDSMHNSVADSVIAQVAAQEEAQRHILRREKLLGAAREEADKSAQEAAVEALNAKIEGFLKSLHGGNAENAALEPLFKHRRYILNYLSWPSHYNFSETNAVVSLTDVAIERFLTLYGDKAYKEQATTLLKKFNLITRTQGELIETEGFFGYGADDISDTCGVPVEGFPEAKIALPADVLSRVVEVNDSPQEDAQYVPKPHSSDADRTGWSRVQYPTGHAR